MEISQKTKSRTTVLPSNSTSGYISEQNKTKQNKTLIQKDTSTSMFIAVLYTIAKIGKQPNCPPTGKWINKM